MTIDELKEEFNLLFVEVNEKYDITSEVFLQNCFDFTEVLSRAGKFLSKTKTFYEGLKVNFEIWEAKTELSIRKYLEDLNEAKSSLNHKPERITEAKVLVELKKDPLNKVKQQELIDAKELLNLAKKSLYVPIKLRVCISKAIIKQRNK